MSVGKWLWLPLLVAAGVGGLYLMFRPAPAQPPELLTVSIGDAIFRTEANGRIVPREELFVRSLVSGQLVELRVRPGHAVKKGDHLATVRIVADPVMLGAARARPVARGARAPLRSRQGLRARPAP